MTVKENADEKERILDGKKSKKNHSYINKRKCENYCFVDFLIALVSGYIDRINLWALIVMLSETKISYFQ